MNLPAVSISERPVDQVENPFPGPGPYETRQSGFFFGRDDAIDELTSLVLSSHIVLLHAQSGSGKSSLLEAGLRPALTELDIPVVESVRFSRSEDAMAAPTSNPFVARTIAALAPAGGDYTTLAEAVRGTSASRAGRMYVLILDQFEEIFADSWLWEARQEFLRQLAEAADAEPRFRVVLGMRSDYLARLIPYEKVLPARLVVRMGLFSLKEPAAHMVIDTAFRRSGKELSEAAVEQIVSALFEVRYGEGEPVGRAEYVNLIQLQIVCRRLWETVEVDTARNESGALETDLQESVSDAVVAFVDDAVANVVAGSQPAEESWIRNWLASLILPGNRRALVPIDGPHAPPEALRTSMERARLIRVELINNSRLAELTHDSMVEAVNRSNERWRRRARVKRTGTLFWLVLLLVTMSVLFYNFVLVSPSANHIAGDDLSQTGAGGSQMEFVVNSHNPFAIASVQTFADPPGRISVTRVRDGVVVAQTQLASYQSEYDLAFPTIPGARYRVSVESSDTRSSGTVDVSAVAGLASLDMAGGSDELSSSDGQPMVLQLPPGAYEVTSDSAVTISGDGVAQKYPGEYVLSVTDRSLLVVTGLAPGADAQITSVTSAGQLDRHGTTSSRFGTAAVGALELGWDDVPAQLGANCDDPQVALKAYAVDAYSDLVTRSQLLIRAPGRYLVTLESPDATMHTCAISVRQSAPEIRAFGRSLVPVAAGANHAALKFRMPEEGLLVGDPHQGLDVSFSIRCSDGSSASSSSSGSRFVALLPARKTCILSVDGDDVTSARQLAVDTWRTPSTTAGRSR